MENYNMNQGYPNQLGEMNQGYPNQPYNMNQGYPNGQWQPYQNAPQQKNKMGFNIASLVLGILSILCCWAYGGVLGVIGIILGIVAFVRKESKCGTAIAGIITSVLGIVILICQIITASTLLGEMSTSTDGNETYDQVMALLEAKSAIAADGNEEATMTAKDPFAGKTFDCGDGSTIYFGEDATFVWYQTDDDHTDNYYEGTYQVYCGGDAANYIVNDLSEYGMTQDEMEDYFVRNADSEFYTLDNCTCLKLRTEDAVIGGVEGVEQAYQKYYMGYMADGYYDGASMDTAEYFMLTERK